MEPRPPLGRRLSYWKCGEDHCRPADRLVHVAGQGGRVGGGLLDIDQQVPARAGHAGGSFQCLASAPQRATAQGGPAHNEQGGNGTGAIARPLRQLGGQIRFALVPGRPGVEGLESVEGPSRDRRLLGREEFAQHGVASQGVAEPEFVRGFLLGLEQKARRSPSERLEN